ncbi:MAG: hypothetical protein AAGI38_12135 [Bacteroidota bacterium]
MILPYQKELEEKDRLLHTVRAQVEWEKERVRQVKELVRHLNRELIKLGLQFELPMNKLMRITELSEKEVIRVINSLIQGKEQKSKD